MISRFFIDRPVFACVIALLIVLGGAVSVSMLPVAQYPKITPPEIHIRATYPGADAQTVAQSVAAPIEEQLSGIPGLIYYSSSSANNGSLSITATFAVGTNQDIAAVEVQNRMQQATSQLPQAVVRQGISVRKSSSSILGVVSLQSDNSRYDTLYLSNYAQIHLIDAILRVPGVGDAHVFGSKNYAMRIWVNPDKLASMGLTVNDVASAIEAQNASFGAGAIGERPVKNKVELTVPLLSPNRLSQPEQYENIVLRANPDGTVVRIKNVATVELGAENYGVQNLVDGKPTVLIGVFLQNDANAINTIAGVRAVMKEAAKSFPSGVTWGIPYDTTKFIHDSITEVLTTLVEAIIIVILVVFIFLQSWRATLIPIVVVPVALVGAFLGMMALGFSINTLTLFGLVLTVGIVVDDAIVVTENVERVMHEDGLGPREAAIKGMTQVSGPVITVVLVLIAVFVPVAFLGGLVGQLYQQFAATIAISVAISGLMALTLSPALCALVLRPQTKRPWFWFRWFNKGFSGVVHGYRGGVGWGLRHAVVMLGIFAVLCYTAYRLDHLIPSGFLPTDDQGYLLNVVQLPEGASLARTEAVNKKVVNFFLHQPQVEHVVTIEGVNLFNGFTNSPNAATSFIALKPFDERVGPKNSAQALMARSYMALGGVAHGRVMTVMPPSIPGLGARTGFEFELEARGNSSVADLYKVEQKFIGAANQQKGLEAMRGSMEYSVPQLMVAVDREKASMMGVSVPDIYGAMNAYLGGLYVNDFNRFGRIWRVMVQAQPQFRASPKDIDKIYVRNSQGGMVPLSSVVKLHWQAGPNIAERFNGYPSVKISGTAAPGVSSGEAMRMVEKLAANPKILPAGYGIEWSGASYQERKAGNQAPMILGFALIVVFLVLAAQYEQWIMPIGILLAVPFAILGALLAIQWRGMSQDVYFQIGLLVLVGLATKNAVLIVQFCTILRREGIPIREAAIRGAVIRFRPIVMTSLAFIFGVLPLAIAAGALSGARHSIGTGIIGGMVAGTFLATLFVPVFFMLIQYGSEKITGKTLQERAQMKARRHDEDITGDI